MLCLNLVHPCLSVYCLCRCFLWASARFPVTALWCIPSPRVRIRLCSTPRCPSSGFFFLDNCASSAPVGLWHPWICGDLLCLHVPWGGVFLAPLVRRVFLPCLHGLLWFCVRVLNATQCSVITHVATEKYGWVSKPGVLGRSRERPASLSLPPPPPQT